MPTQGMEVCIFIMAEFGVMYIISMENWFKLLNMSLPEWQEVLSRY